MSLGVITEGPKLPLSAALMNLSLCGNCSSSDILPMGNKMAAQIVSS